MRTRQKAGDIDSDKYNHNSEHSNKVERMEKSDSNDRENEMDTHFIISIIKILCTCQ